MDSREQQTTNIQDQPEKKPELEPARAYAVPPKPNPSVDFSTMRIRLPALAVLAKWRTIARDTFFVVSALLLIAGFLYWKFYLNGMNTKSLSDGGYSYSFTFSRPAKIKQFSNGMRGYTTDADHSAIVGPISGLPELCGLKGDPYSLAFKVNVYGATRSVCTTQDGQDRQIYMLSFQAQHQYHEFMVTYGYSQDPNIYPKLQTIFESIEVSK